MFSTKQTIVGKTTRGFMALTDNKREKKSKRDKNRPVTTEHNYRWSDQQKMEAIQTWLAVGNLSLTSRILNIPEITLRVWKASSWWNEAVEDLRLSENIKVTARMRKLIEASQNIVAQRLETGDPFFNQKKGIVEYKPVSLKDAHKVAVDLMDRVPELERLTTDDKSTVQKDDDKLERLAERFAEMATKSIEKQINKKRTVDVTVKDVTDAVYDQREEGLQEGAGLGTQEQAGESETEGSEEFGSFHDDGSREG